MLSYEVRDKELYITFSGVIGTPSFWGNEEDFLGFANLREIIEAHRAEVKGVTLEICSPGGDVLEAFAMFNYLNNIGGILLTADVTGWAASAASYLIMAADVIRIHANSFIMIHEPTVITGGDRQEHRKAAAILEDVYRSLVDAYMLHSNAPRAEIEALVTEETWLDAPRALALGLADEILDPLPAAALAELKFASKIQNYIKDDHMKKRKTLRNDVTEDPAVVPAPPAPDESESADHAPAENEESASAEPAPDASESQCTRAEDSAISELASRMEAMAHEIEDLKNALAVAQSAEASAKEELAGLRDRIARLTSGVKKTTAAPADAAEDWKTLCPPGSSADHYIRMRKEHPQAFANYLKSIR